MVFYIHTAAPIYPPSTLIVTLLVFFLNFALLQCQCYWLGLINCSLLSDRLSFVVHFELKCLQRVNVRLKMKCLRMDIWYEINSK